MWAIGSDDRRRIIHKLTYRSMVCSRKLSQWQFFFVVLAVRRSYTNNQIVSFTVLISFLLLLLFGFLFFGCYRKLPTIDFSTKKNAFFLVRNKKLYGKLKKYYQNEGISDKELEHLRSLTHPTGLKDNILYTWKYVI